MGKRTTRFRRARWVGGNSRNGVPPWHIAAWAYKKGALYASYEALCGFSIRSPWADQRGTLLSIAVKVPGDGHPECKRCLKRAELSKRRGTEE